MDVNKTWFAAVCREPYRLFYPLGIIAGTVGVMQWVFYALGIASTYSGFLHSSIQMMIYMNCFIVGFLMTSLPRFTQTVTTRWWELITAVGLFAGIGIFLGLGQWILAECVLLGVYIFLMFYALSRLRKRPPSATRGNPPVELIWVPIGVVHGFLGTIIFICGQMKLLPAWALHVGKPMMDQGFLVCLVVGVGGFLIPRLMGVHEKDTEVSVRGKVQYYLVCALLFMGSFFVEGFGLSALGYGMRAMAVSAAFLKTNVLTKLPVDGGFYVWMAWVSVRLVAAGFWGAAFFNQHSILMLHITFIGGFSLMIFAVASMVIVSHSGSGARLKTGLWILPVVAFGVGLSLVGRLIVGFFPDAYFQLLGFAAGIWVVCAWAWLMYMLPHIVKVPVDDEFERLHVQEKSKRV